MRGRCCSHRVSGEHAQVVARQLWHRYPACGQILSWHSLAYLTDLMNGKCNERWLTPGQHEYLENLYEQVMGGPMYCYVCELAGNVTRDYAPCPQPRRKEETDDVLETIADLNERLLVLEGVQVADRRRQERDSYHGRRPFDTDEVPEIPFG